jgi:hypothetical protein
MNNAKQIKDNESDDRNFDPAHKVSIEQLLAICHYAEQQSLYKFCKFKFTVQ